MNEKQFFSLLNRPIEIYGTEMTSISGILFFH